jgi:hypothetical protein
LVGLTSLITENPPMPPKLNRERALFVLGKIDEILAWEQRKDTERDTKFAELGRYLCEVREGQYWRLEKLKSFDEFLARKFPASRRKAYYLMSIHENLPPQARRELKEIGWTKGLDLAKVARRDRQKFNCATWLHRAKALSKDQFRREVERELTGEDREPWELVYFKLYKSQIPVIDRALETAALMLGSDRSRAYCLEMICADFLAGANLDNGDPQTLVFSMTRFFRFLPKHLQHSFLETVGEVSHEPDSAKVTAPAR